MHKRGKDGPAQHRTADNPASSRQRQSCQTAPFHAAFRRGERCGGLGLRAGKMTARFGSGRGLDFV